METIKLSIEQPLSQDNFVKRVEFEIAQDSTLDDMLDIFKDLLIIMGYYISDNEQLEITKGEQDA